MTTETIETNRRILAIQKKVIEDEKVILSGRIRNYLQSHKTETLVDIMLSIYQLGREHQRMEFYENTVMNANEKESQKKYKKDLKKAFK